MNKLFALMENGWGRGLRVLLGLALIYLGLATLGETAGVIVALIGIVPIVMGIMGPCLMRIAANQLHHA